ncbi:MAG: DUF21 domain-containing protein, partial [Planctomycetales bacterium]|nr:DUF21 domain-containing protein [Planctomycetales bacterium]
MQAIWEVAPWLLGMAVLIAASAFFSGAEAALFCLRWRDRRALASGNRAQRFAERLLHDPDRLLSAVLFWNLVVNLSYFAIASTVGLKLRRDPTVGDLELVAFTVGALLVLIFFSEMLPKSVAVVKAPMISTFVAIPLTVAVRLVDPVMPALRFVNLVSRRVLWPGFQTEPSLALSDLERAIEMSTTDADLAKHEKSLLQNIVSLSDIRTDEWMRPRKQFRAFVPPVRLADLNGELPQGGYLFLGEEDGSVVSAVNLTRLCDLKVDHLEEHAAQVIYVPWCATVADTLQRFQQEDRDVAAVVNEFGETIGVLTLVDIVETIFGHQPSRVERVLNREPIEPVGDGTWLVATLTNLRSLSRHFDRKLPSSRYSTVGGVMHETLERIPIPGDRCRWGPFELELLSDVEQGRGV